MSSKIQRLGLIETLVGQISSFTSFQGLSHTIPHITKNFARRVRSFAYLDKESDTGVDWVLGVVPIFLQLWNGTGKITINHGH